MARRSRHSSAVVAALACAALGACDQPQAKAPPPPPPPAPAVQPVSTAPKPPPAVLGNAVETEVPIVVSGGTFLVPVTINDTITLKFVIDTGASDVTIPADVASTLIRSGTITKDDFIGTQTFVLADGTPVPSPEFRIRSLKVGTLVLHDVTASVTNSEGSLLLGQSFLTRLANWSFDNGTQVLHLKAAPGQADAESPAGATAMEASASIPEQGQPPETAASDGAAAAAADRAQSYLAAWSSPSDPTGDAIRSFYAPVVKFYGKDESLDQLMAGKAAFAKRWPTRSYVARPASISTQCTDEHVCKVSGCSTGQRQTRRAVAIRRVLPRFR